MIAFSGRSLAVAACAAATLATAVSVAPAASAANSAARCSVYDYTPTHGVYSYATSSTVTHALQVGIAPGGTHSETRTASFQREVIAKSSKSADVGGSLSWLWGSINAHFKTSVQKTDAHTTTSSSKVTDTVHNSSHENEFFIAYRGVTEYTGKVYVTHCAADNSSGTGSVKRHYYRYSNYSGGGEGIIWCKGSGNGSALGKAAIKEYCH